MTLAAAGRRHPRLKLMEAFMYRHHPQWKLAKQLVDTGKIGTLADDPNFLLVLQRRPREHSARSDDGGRRR